MPGATRQRLFDRKVKPFEKLESMEKDEIRPGWFVDRSLVKYAIHGVSRIALSDVHADLPFQVYDDRAALDEMKQYSVLILGGKSVI